MVKGMVFKCFILLLLSSFIYSTHPQQHCTVARQPLNNALETCWNKLQNDWFINPEQPFSLAVMEDALIGFHYNDESQVIDLNSNKIFSYFKKNQIPII